ncbi:MAG: hypothetical protein QOD92_1559 [Acidimicrobiaceae bacterium]
MWLPRPLLQVIRAVPTKPKGMANEPTVERRIATRYRTEVMLGLEALGGDVLVEGLVQDLSKGGVRAIIPSLLPEGGRAFAVITPPGELPIVAMIEVIAQQVIVEDGTVELRARFVELSPPNRDRLNSLCEPDTSTVAC